MTTIGGITQHGVFDTAAAVSGATGAQQTQPVAGSFWVEYPPFENAAAAKAAGLTPGMPYYDKYYGIQQVRSD